MNYSQYFRQTWYVKQTKRSRPNGGRRNNIITYVLVIVPTYCIQPLKIHVRDVFPTFRPIRKSTSAPTVKLIHFRCPHNSRWSLWKLDSLQFLKRYRLWYQQYSRTRKNNERISRRYSISHDVQTRRRRWIDGCSKTGLHACTNTNHAKHAGEVRNSSTVERSVAGVECRRYGLDAVNEEILYFIGVKDKETVKAVLSSYTI